MPITFDKVLKSISKYYLIKNRANDKTVLKRGMKIEVPYFSRKILYDGFHHWSRASHKKVLTPFHIYGSSDGHILLPPSIYTNVIATSKPIDFETLSLDELAKYCDENKIQLRQINLNEFDAYLLSDNSKFTLSYL